MLSESICLCVERKHCMKSSWVVIIIYLQFLPTHATTIAALFALMLVDMNLLTLLELCMYILFRRFLVYLILMLCMHIDYAYIHYLEGS
jgi:hypothetical protein